MEDPSFGTITYDRGTIGTPNKYVRRHEIYVSPRKKCVGCRKIAYKTAIITNRYEVVPRCTQRHWHLEEPLARMEKSSWTVTNKFQKSSIEQNNSAQNT